MSDKQTANQSRPWSIAPQKNIIDIAVERVDIVALDYQRETVERVAYSAYDAGLVSLVERDQLLGLADMLSDICAENLK